MDVLLARVPPMDHTHQSGGIRPPNEASDDVVCCSPCSGCVIAVNALEWSQFALGKLVALGVGTFFLAMITLALSLCSVG
jgi:hypothetical protein